MVCFANSEIVAECPKCHRETLRVEILDSGWVRTEYGQSHYLEGPADCRKCGHKEHWKDESI